MDKTPTLILASSNPNKVRQFRDFFAELPWDLRPQGEYQVEDVEETGLSFVENAIIKARHAAGQTRMPALADDSGLEVDALHGAPGVFSARYAGKGASDGDNIAKLLTALAGVPEQARTARYHCVLVFMRHANDPTPVISHAAWEGRILDAPRGEGGFGYDPLFWVPEKGCTSAQLPSAESFPLSHRGRAMAQMLTQLQSV